MRFAELCVLEIGKDAGRVERECRIAGQIAGERSICHTLRAVVLNAAVDKAGIVAAELLRDGIAAGVPWTRNLKAHHNGRSGCPGPSAQLRCLPDGSSRKARSRL